MGGVNHAEGVYIIRGLLWYIINTKCGILSGRGQIRVGA